MREKTERRKGSSFLLLCWHKIPAVESLPEAPCPLRTVKQRIATAFCIEGVSPAYIKHRYIDPRKDHYRTRMTHTLEVAQMGGPLHGHWI